MIVTRRLKRWCWQGEEQALESLPSGITLLRRWMVERTFAWLDRSRRLSKDYEVLPATAEAWIHLAISSPLLRRFVPYPRFSQVLDSVENTINCPTTDRFGLFVGDAMDDVIARGFGVRSR